MSDGGPCRCVTCGDVGPWPAGDEICRDCLDLEMEALKVQLAEARALLMDVEFSGYRECQWCRAHEVHAPDCRLKKALHG